MSFSHKKKSILIFVALLLILISGFFLRYESGLETEVLNPLRADARQYFMYAYNLRHKNTYSQEVGAPADLESAVQPDALRTPGYPLFLTLFVDGLPNARMMNRILFSQVMLSTFTILLTFLLFQSFLSPLWALGPTLLVALSPHLIVSNSYILTETLFCFLLLLLGYLFTLFAKRPSVWFAALIGIVIGITSLVRPSLQFFSLVLACFLTFHYGWRKGVFTSAALLVGFSLAFLPWIGWNLYTLNKPTDNRLMVNFLHHGLYPDFMYEGIPQSHGFPYRYDPKAEEISADTFSVIGEISDRFVRAPLQHAKWYLLDKSRVFWSWDIIQGSGDVFVYPVTNSPYFHNTFFRVTHGLMYVLHYPLLALTIFGCFMAWFPPAKLNPTQESLLTALFCSLLLIYYTLIHMLGAPFPRYSVPLRPFLYGMAMFALYVFLNQVENRSITKKAELPK